ncbi:transposable element Tcb2 transposase [Trichonephila clavipes]|nr:transposable element Tcb2 transposase [Trichonephila clavipes]
MTEGEVSTHGGNDCTASSRQLAEPWSVATGLLVPALSIHPCLRHLGLRARVLLYRILLAANRRRLHLQWAHEHKVWQDDWHQVVFSDDSCFNLWDHDGCIRVRRYAGERFSPECVIDMSPIEDVWDLVGRRLARDPGLAPSKDELLLRIQAI